MNKKAIKELSDEIKLQRFKTKKTQENCANILNMSIPTYKNLEDNPNKLDLEQAIKLFNYIGFDVSAIFLKYILQNAIN